MIMEQLLESRDAHIACLNEQLSHFRERNGVLESTVGGLQEKIQGLESGLNRKDAEMLGLRAKLGEKDDELMAVMKKNKSMREQIDGLSEAVKELERKRCLSAQAEEASAKQIQELSFLLEEKSAALTSATADAAKHKELARDLGKSLTQKVEELGSCRARCDTLTTSLNSYQDELKYVQDEKERQLKSFQEKLALSEFHLKEIATRLQAKTEEMNQVKKELDIKEAQLACMSEELREFRERNSALQSTVGCLKDRIQVQCTRLTEKEAEVSGLEAKLMGVHAQLGEKEEEMQNLLRKNKVLHEQNDFLKQAVQDYQEKRAQRSQEMELQSKVKDLEGKELQLISLKEEAQQLRDKNSSLDFTVQSLQVKASKLAEELKNSEVKGQQLLGKLTEAEATLASNRDLISNLELKVELGNQISAKMEGANAKIKELEAVLADLMAFAEDKNEKLDASEWAVQQLGIFEVSKVKANLAQAERERVQLTHRCADLEGELKVKEEELLDMETCVRQLRGGEAEYETLKRNFQILVEKHESLKAEHEQAMTTINDYSSQLHEQMEGNFRLTQVIEELKRELADFHRDALVTNNKLKDVQVELQKTQLNSKCLVHQMLLLHENLLHEGKALLEFGTERKTVSSPPTPYSQDALLIRKLAVPECSESPPDENILRSAQTKAKSDNTISEAKENAPSIGKQNLVPGGSVLVERLPLQVLQLSDV